jgi:hypothetical protein
MIAARMSTRMMTGRISFIVGSNRAMHMNLSGDRPGLIF